MPSVSDLLTTIKDLATVGSGDTTDDTRIMRYFNMVYKDIYRKTARMAPTKLLAQETVTITSGAGTMAATPFSVTFVKDTGNNNNPLVAKTLLDIEDMFPAMDGTGSPTYYYITGDTTINTYPINSTTVKVRYVPSSATLTSASAESDIKVPPEFHDMLIWGTLMYVNFDERDKTFGAEQQTAGTLYSVALGDYQDWLVNGQSREQIRTRANPLG